MRLRRVDPAYVFSEAKQIRRLYEQSPSVVSHAAAVQQVTIHIIPERQQYIFQIAVVAYIKRRAGMHQVGDQKVSIEILGGFKKRESRIRQNRVVLADEAERKSFGVLIIPLGTDDVIVQAAD